MPEFRGDQRREALLRLISVYKLDMLLHLRDRLETNILTKHHIFHNAMGLAMKDLPRCLLAEIMNERVNGKVEHVFQDICAEIVLKEMQFSYNVGEDPVVDRITDSNDVIQDYTPG